MKLKYINIDGYGMLVDEDPEIKKGDWVYWKDPEGLTSDINKVIEVSTEMIFLSHPKHAETEALPSECFKVILADDYFNIDLPVRHNSEELEIKETRVYCLDTLDISIDKGFEELTEEEWITECEKQGRIYSLEGFQRAFNEEEINTNTDVIKIIKN